MDVGTMSWFSNAASGQTALPFERGSCVSDKKSLPSMFFYKDLSDQRFVFQPLAGATMGSRRKVILKKRKERREQPHFTPNDIVLAIKGVETSGLDVYGVEITPTGAINIWTQPPPRQGLTETQVSTNPPDDIPSVKKQT
jgi:hypothetical protein